LELKELEGRILDGNIIQINAGGMASGGLRNERDGQVFFGTIKVLNGKVQFTFILFRLLMILLLT
jgi:hypothetical protein